MKILPNVLGDFAAIFHFVFLGFGRIYTRTIF